MDQKYRLKLLAIVGPTASGKSAWAVELAKQFNGVVLSADSRQVYKKLDEMTAKITPAQMQGIPHYLIDIVNIGDYFSVTEYQKQAYEILDRLQRDNAATSHPTLPIIAGGTGLYVSAICDGYEFSDVKPDPALRARLEKMPVDELAKKLLSLNPKTKVDLRNPRRIIRAIEAHVNGSGAKPARKARYDVLRIGIQKDMEEIRNAIRERVQNLDEKRLVREAGLLKGTENPLSLYYQPVQAWLDGDISRDEMYSTMTFAHIHYARRQMTWFRKDKQIIWVKTLAEAQDLVEKWLKN